MYCVSQKFLSKPPKLWRTYGHVNIVSRCKYLDVHLAPLEYHKHKSIMQSWSTIKNNKITNPRPVKRVNRLDVLLTHLVGQWRHGAPYHQQLVRVKNREIVECHDRYYECNHYTLQRRHNGCDGVSNHQPHHCLLNRLFTVYSKKTPKLRITGLCQSWLCAVPKPAVTVRVWV